MGRATQLSDTTGVTQVKADHKAKQASVLFHVNPSAVGTHFQDTQTCF